MSSRTDKIQEDLTKLLAEIEHPDDREEIRQLRADVKAAAVRADLKKHDGLKMLFKYFKEQVKKINEQLLYNKEITDDQRKLLFTRRDWINDLFHFFEIKHVLQAAEDVVESGAE